MNPIIKGAVAEFYITAFLDEFPLRKVLDLDVNCFEYNKIEQMNLSETPIYWINGDNKTKRIRHDSRFVFNTNEMMQSLLIEVFSIFPYKKLIQGKNLRAKRLFLTGLTIKSLAPKVQKITKS